MIEFERNRVSAQNSTIETSRIAQKQSKQKNLDLY
jgi:hypothetical protein